MSGEHHPYDYSLRLPEVQHYLYTFRGEIRCKLFYRLT